MTVIIVCVALMGQALAYSVSSCRVMSMQAMNAQAMNAQAVHPQNQFQEMSAMQHRDHQMATDIISNDQNADKNNTDHNKCEESEKASDNCCVKSCDCFTGGCSSVAALIVDHTADALGDFSFKITSSANKAKSQLQKSLYRPPILS